jgi:hypothetical protein
VLFKLVPRTFHINILLSRNIQTHLEKRRGTSLCELAECSFINSFEVSTNLTIHDGCTLPERGKSTNLKQLMA